MRKFLYSRWFFLLMAIVCIVDLFADIGHAIWGWDTLIYISIGFDAVVAVMACWIFADLQRRRPKHGDDSRG